MSTYPNNQRALYGQRLAQVWRRQCFWASNGEPEAGLTLLECLAAIIVVGLIGAAITPVLVLSVATRVQSQKSEQALALAQSEVDAVRAIIEAGGNGDDDDNDGIDDVVFNALPPIADNLGEDDPITAGLAPNARAPEATESVRYPANYQQLRIVDVDGDDEDDFGIQVYRDEAIGTGDAVAFKVGVRVYDIRSVEDNLANLETAQASIGLTSSSDGDRAQQPLSALYAEITGSERAQSLCTFVDYLGDTNDEKPLGCDGVTAPTPP